MKPLILFANRRREEFLPAEGASEKLGVMDKTVVEVLSGKYPLEKKPLVLRWKCTWQRLFLSPWVLQRKRSIQLHKNFQGAKGLVERIRKPYGGGY